jgi:DNA-binding phage protein
MNKNSQNKLKKQTDNDSSDVSSYDEDYDNMTSDEISQKGKDKFFKTELMEKIIKYIKIDDSIKDKQKELREQTKCLKTQKNDMEKYILSYLENIDEDYVNIDGTAKLTKTTTTSKGMIKPDNIKISVLEGLKKQNVQIDDKKISALLENVIECIDKNRPTKTRTYIKRTKGKVNKTLRKIAEKNENEDSDNEELPKYSSEKKDKKIKK